MFTCARCGAEFESPFCPQCGAPAPAGAVDDDAAPQLTEREVVENSRVGRDVAPRQAPAQRVVDDGRGPAGAAFPIADSKENATLSWNGNSPAHEALEDADEKGLPFYRKTWFWVVVTIVVVLIVCWACWELFARVWFNLTYSGPSIPNSVAGAPGSNGTV